MAAKKPKNVVLIPGGILREGRGRFGQNLLVKKKVVYLQKKKSK